MNEGMLIAVCTGCGRVLPDIDTELPKNALGPYFCDSGPCRNIWADALARGNRGVIASPSVPVVQEDNAIAYEK
jgi:hypothetical protein